MRGLLEYFKTEQILALSQSFMRAARLNPRSEFELETLVSHLRPIWITLPEMIHLAVPEKFGFTVNFADIFVLFALDTRLQGRIYFDDYCLFVARCAEYRRLRNIPACDFPAHLAASLVFDVTDFVAACAHRQRFADASMQHSGLDAQPAAAMNSAVFGTGRRAAPPARCAVSSGSLAPSASFVAAHAATATAYATHQHAAATLAGARHLQDPSLPCSGSGAGTTVTATATVSVSVSISAAEPGSAAAAVSAAAAPQNPFAQLLLAVSDECSAHPSPPPAPPAAQHGDAAAPSARALLRLGARAAAAHAIATLNRHPGCAPAPALTATAADAAASSAVTAALAAARDRCAAAQAAKDAALAAEAAARAAAAEAAARAATEAEAARERAAAECAERARAEAEAQAAREAAASLAPPVDYDSEDEEAPPAPWDHGFGLEELGLGLGFGFGDAATAVAGAADAAAAGPEGEDEDAAAADATTADAAAAGPARGPREVACSGYDDDAGGPTALAAAYVDDDALFDWTAAATAALDAAAAADATTAAAGNTTAMACSVLAGFGPDFALGSAAHTDDDANAGWALPPCATTARLPSVALVAAAAPALAFPYRQALSARTEVAHAAALAAAAQAAAAAAHGPGAAPPAALVDAQKLASDARAVAGTLMSMETALGAVTRGPTGSVSGAVVAAAGEAAATTGPGAAALHRWLVRLLLAQPLWQLPQPLAPGEVRWEAVAALQAALGPVAAAAGASAAATDDGVARAFASTPHGLRVGRRGRADAAQRATAAAAARRDDARVKRARRRDLAQARATAKEMQRQQDELEQQQQQQNKTPRPSSSRRPSPAASPRSASASGFLSPPAVALGQAASSTAAGPLSPSQSPHLQPQPHAQSQRLLLQSDSPLASAAGVQLSVFPKSESTASTSASASAAALSPLNATAAAAAPAFTPGVRRNRTPPSGALNSSINAGANSASGRVPRLGSATKRVGVAVPQLALHALQPLEPRRPAPQRRLRGVGPGGAAAVAAAAAAVKRYGPRARVTEAATLLRVCGARGDARPLLLSRVAPVVGALADSLVSSLWTLQSGTPGTAGFAAGRAQPEAAGDALLRAELESVLEEHSVVQAVRNVTAFAMAPHALSAADAALYVARAVARFRQGLCGARAAWRRVEAVLSPVRFAPVDYGGAELTELARLLAAEVAGPTPQLALTVHLCLYTLTVLGSLTGPRYAPARLLRVAEGVCACVPALRRLLGRYVVRSVSASDLARFARALAALALTERAGDGAREAASVLLEAVNPLANVPREERLATLLSSIDALVERAKSRFPEGPSAALTAFDVSEADE